MALQNLAPKRHDGRIIIHFDYDCFYASVFERENPTLRHLPLAVQQKQIIVTCNYEARRRGLHKLQLVREAKKKCPDAIIVLGEDLTRFRDASKELYTFLRTFSWNGKVERLGFDEVFLDITDIVDYNVDLLSRHDLTACFFHLDRNDPTLGFAFDASTICGHCFPKIPSSASPNVDDFAGLYLRLVLGSHLAQHMRHRLEEEKGYTSTVGISTNKLISKLVGNLNKPKGQTTLAPPYFCHMGEVESNITQLVDTHDIGKIPGIGFKTAQKIREHVRGRPGAFDAGLIYGGTKETISVRDVRLHANLGPELLERVLGAPGVPKGIGNRVWGLLNGVDDSEVSEAKDVPQQISIEDSYIKLNDMESVRKELVMLTHSLLRRMRIDLMSISEETDETYDKGKEELNQGRRNATSEHWIVRPRILRLTTRPRPPLNPDGSRPRSFTRISRSCNMPSVMLSNSHSTDAIIQKIVNEALIPLFRKLHPEPSGWDISLINLCATNMALSAMDNKIGAGRDIGRMFRRQETMLKEWKVDTAPSDHDAEISPAENIDLTPAQDRDGETATQTCQDDVQLGSEDAHIATQDSHVDESSWEIENEAADTGEACKLCKAFMPSFAMVAHQRFHALPD